MRLDDAGLRERARGEIRATVYSYLKENRHLEHVVDEIMVELDHYAFALRDAFRADLRACVEALDRAMDAAYEDNWAPSDRWRAAKAALARPGVQAARKETR